jgi:hypothetical protein
MPGCRRYVIPAHDAKTAIAHFYHADSRDPVVIRNDTTRVRKKKNSIAKRSKPAIITRVGTPSNSTALSKLVTLCDTVTVTQG